jgi:thiol-disulfide isomerase/thioredoxin
MNWASRLSKKKWRPIVVGVVVIVGLVAAISALTGGNAPSSSTKSHSELVGRRIKDFSLGGLSGGTLDAPWESGRPSVLIFFASYCGPCQGEMPKIASYIRTHNPSPVDVLAIDAIDERSSAQAMVKRDDVTFPVAFDPNGVVTNGVFGFGEIPESVFVSPKGFVEKVYYGAIPEYQLMRGIAMLKASR